MLLLYLVNCQEIKSDEHQLCSHLCLCVYTHTHIYMNTGCDQIKHSQKWLYESNKRNIQLVTNLSWKLIADILEEGIGQLQSVPSPPICSLSLTISGTSLAAVLLCLLLPLNLSSVVPNSVLNPYIPLASTMLTGNTLQALQQFSISSPKQK